MDDVQPRLLTCFQAVFPGRDAAALLRLNQASEPAWDSLASVTLVRLIEEQFNVQVDLFDMEEIDSFQTMENHIRNVQSAGA
jgi:hypothetical protein